MRWDELQRRARPAAIGAVALLFLPPAATANPMLTTGAYKIACSQKDDDVLVAFCNGYAQSVLDFALASGSACIPDGTRPSDIAGAIESLAFDKIGTEGFPETQPAIMMALAVVNNVYPCNR